MLTKEQKENYIKHDGAYCPYCGSQNISAQDFDGTSQRVDCDDCGERWTDIYQLVDVE